jgi:hypothetical protein
MSILTNKYASFFEEFKEKANSNSNFPVDKFCVEMKNVLNELEKSSLLSKRFEMLIPKKFLISYQGVLVLCFDGFSNEMIFLKDFLTNNCKELADENMGSKWPKITLGCLKDGKSLTKIQAEKLNDLCEKMSKELLSKEWKSIDLEPLSIVHFRCRDLNPKNCISSIELISSNNKKQKLTNNNDENNNMEKKFASSNLSSHLYVEEKVLKEIQDFDNYFKKITIQGNRESHYCIPMQNEKTELTMVFRLGKEQQENFNLIEKFRKAIKQELEKEEDLYHFFEDSCLHITLRSIVPKPPPQ